MSTLSFIIPSTPATPPRESASLQHHESPAHDGASFDSLIQHALASPARAAHSKAGESVTAPKKPGSTGRPANGSGNKFRQSPGVEDSPASTVAKNSDRAIKSSTDDHNSATDDAEDSDDSAQPSDKIHSPSVSALTAAPIVPFPVPIPPLTLPEGRGIDCTESANESTPAASENGVALPPVQGPTGSVKPKVVGNPTDDVVNDMKLKNFSEPTPSQKETATEAPAAIPAKDPDAASSSTAIQLPHPADNSFERVLKPVIQDLLPMTSDSVGTSSAQQEGQMKKAAKTVKNAGAQQDLPSELAAPAHVESVGVTRPLDDSMAFSNRIEITAATTATGTRPDNSVEPAQLTITASAPNNDAQLRTLERTQDVVALHAFRLRDTNAESLRVTIRPGDGIQLSLNLQKQAGSVQAQASLHQGNFELLSAHWGALQRHLETQGIHLGPLERQIDSFAGNSNHPKQSDSRPSNDDATPIAQTADLALAGSTTVPPGKSVRRPSLHHGWESWA